MRAAAGTRPPRRAGRSTLRVRGGRACRRRRIPVVTVLVDGVAVATRADGGGVRRTSRSRFRARAGAPRLTARPAQLDDVRARPRRSAATRGHARSAVARAGRHRARAAPGARRGGAVVGRDGRGDRAARRHAGIGDRRRGRARRRRRRPSSRAASVPSPTTRRTVVRAGAGWIALALDRRCRWPPSTGARPAAAQHRAIRRRVFGGGALPEAARAAPSRTWVSATRCSTRTGSRACSAGNLYFTSIAPGGYSFPYPPGLYVFASLFAGLVRRGAGDMALLRIICTRGRRRRRPPALSARRAQLGRPSRGGDGGRDLSPDAARISAC